MADSFSSGSEVIQKLVALGGYARKLADAFGMRTFALHEAQGSSDRARENKESTPFEVLSLFWRALEDSNLRPTGS